jgi:hypothetical protein
MSALSFLNLFPVLIQFKGLIELIHVCIVILSDCGPVEYWELPGKRKEGYCPVIKS